MARDGAPCYADGMQRGSRRPWGAWALAVASALVPGTGQLARRRWGDALLFTLVAAWLHLTLAGLAARGGPPPAWGWVLGAARALGERGGAQLTAPTMVVFTVLAAWLHLWAARDALER